MSTRGSMINAWILALALCVAGPGCDTFKELTGGGKKTTTDKSDDDDDDDKDDDDKDDDDKGKGKGKDKDKDKDKDDDDKDDDDKDDDDKDDDKGSKRKPGPGASLRQVVEAHQGYEKCLESMQRSMPPDLGKDLLGYNNIPDGLCRTREAMKKNNPQACALVRSYSMKKGCRTMYAIFRKKPNECYLGYPKRRGRDGYCLALSTRNVNLCRAARTQAEEVRCKAILARNPDSCGEMTRHTDRQECKAEVNRWKSEMSEVAEAETAAEFKPKMEFTLKLAGGQTALEFDRVTSTCADFGAVVPTSDDGVAQVNLCEYYSYAYRFNRGGPTINYRMRRIKVDLSFKAPPGEKGKVSFGSDANFSLRLPSNTVYSKDPTGVVRLSRFERKRGGRVTGTFKVTVSSYVKGKLTVEGKFDTFVRDLVAPSLMKKSPSYRRRPISRRPTGGILGGLSGLGGLRTGTKKFAALLSAATFSEEDKGMKMTNILYGSIWTRLGLKNNDVLLAVDGSATKTKSSVVRIRGVLRKAKKLKIKVKRNGRPMTINVNTAALDRIRAEFAL